MNQNTKLIIYYLNQKYLPSDYDICCTYRSINCNYIYELLDIFLKYGYIESNLYNDFVSENGIMSKSIINDNNKLIYYEKENIYKKMYVNDTLANILYIIEKSNETIIDSKYFIYCVQNFNGAVLEYIHDTYGYIPDLINIMTAPRYKQRIACMRQFIQNKISKL